MRTLINDDPNWNISASQAWNERGAWPARWIACRDAGQPPFVVVYRVRFTLDAPAVIRLHVSADERYELWLDGERIGRGPERGDSQHWFFETYDLRLDAGDHMLIARVTALGEYAPIAQSSLQPGFLLCPDDEIYGVLLATGSAPWEAKGLDGVSFTPPPAAFAVGHRIVVDGARYGWGWERGAGEGWLPALALHLGYSATKRNEVAPNEHLLKPATLPPMLDEPRHIGRARHISAPPLSETHAIPLRPADHLANEEDGWNALLRGVAPLILPPHTRRRVIIDLDDYYCAYPELIVSGGEQATVRVYWQESLFEDPQTWRRSDRNRIDDCYFTMMWWHRDGLGDHWTLDGGDRRRLETLWWSAGRYVELLVETSNHPLTIEQLRFDETRYPLECESRFDARDERLIRAIPMMFRALQMCSHETYMDCPFYEQLMYAGDTRLECLVTYVTSRDVRLPRKALRMFDWSRLPDGLTQSRYPSRLRQIIPPFSLWWTTMVYDYLMWRGDLPFVRSLLPGVRAVLDAFTQLRGDDRLVRSPEGWNYVDWVRAWPSGEPPGAQPGAICGPINWQYVYALVRAAEVEAACGEAELSARWRRLAAETTQALITRYWNAERGLFADDAEHTIFTEHSQCLAVLSGMLGQEQRAAIAKSLFTTAGLTQPTVYFMHYFFETCRELGRIDQFFKRLEFWFEMERLGFKTTYEMNDPTSTRSDCHAWGAHPLYHYFSSVLGIRPTSAGCATVEIAPQLGSLERAGGRLVHPRGDIVVELRTENGALHGQVELPEGVTGQLRLGDRTMVLHEGRQSF
jgi:hypothetical protein